MKGEKKEEVETEDQMETVGGSWDCAFTGSSLDTVMGLGSWSVDIYMKWLFLHWSPVRYPSES